MLRHTEIEILGDPAVVRWTRAKLVDGLLNAAIALGVATIALSGWSRSGAGVALSFAVSALVAAIIAGVKARHPPLVLVRNDEAGASFGRAEIIRARDVPRVIVLDSDEHRRLPGILHSTRGRTVRLYLDLASAPVPRLIYERPWNHFGVVERRAKELAAFLGVTMESIGAD